MMPGLLGALPEPPEDMRAQLAAVADPLSGKNAAFFPPGTNVPRVPRGLQRVDRPEGTLVTNRPGKAMHFATTPRLTDTHLAGLLGHPQTKTDVMAEALRGGEPLAVQAVTPQGAVAHESFATLRRIAQAIQAARAAAAPSGSVRVTTVPQAAMRRVAG